MHSVLVIVRLIWSCLQLCVCEEVTLTTAIPRHNDVSVKPTTLHSWIAVDNAGEQYSVLPDIFYKTGNDVDFRRLNHDHDIWNWDYWCQLQAQKGNCTKNLNRYFYNSQLDQCDTFSYSGCFGNKNNFKTLLDCGRHCKGAALSPPKYIDRTISCSLQPNAGQCVALFNKYYYDVNEGTCKLFVYGGCGGNSNRFSSQQRCLQKCQNKLNFIEDK